MAKKDMEKKAREFVLGEARAVDRMCPTLRSVGRNLTALYLEGKLDEVYSRENTIKDIQKILLRKSKANVLLTGPAGCGKTAIAERLAAVLVGRFIEQAKKEIEAKTAYDKEYKAWQKRFRQAEENDEDFDEPRPEMEEVPKGLLSNIVLYEVSLTSLVSGTKYRGDMEERVQNLLNECKSNPNLVLFIDEIHQIVKCGSAEGSEGAAQMLKPALARKDICVIGATTTDEAEFIRKDKALARRFNEIKVAPLSGSCAVQTAENIMADYAKHHGIVSSPAWAENIVAKLNAFLPHTVFPDNFINVVDETMAGAKFDGLTEVDMTHYNATLSRMAGVIIL